MSVAVLILVTFFLQVSPQIIAEEGSGALLPCEYKGSNLSQSDVLIWKNSSDDTLISLLPLDKEYNQRVLRKGRVSVFPYLFKDGNYSIILHNVTRKDNGTYECHISGVSHKEFVKLKVTDKKRNTENEGVVKPHSDATVNKPSECYMMIVASFHFFFHLKR